MQRLTIINQLADPIAANHRDYPVRVGIDGFAATGKTTLKLNPLQAAS